MNLPGVLLRKRLRPFVVIGHLPDSELQRRYCVTAKSPSLAASKVQRWGVYVDGVSTVDVRNPVRDSELYGESDSESDVG